MGKRFVANVGFIAGEAAEAFRYRAALQADDVKVFTADRTITEMTRDLAFFDADAVIATGQRTGDAATMEEIDEIGAATHLPLLVGSGVTPANVAAILAKAQGAIVASSLKVDSVWWNRFEPARVTALMLAAGPVLETAG